MNTRLIADLALAPLAGYVGTKVMEPVSAKLYELESEQDRKREDEARPGAPYAIAARKAADLGGLTLTDTQHDRLALAFHYGLAVQWAPLYPLLRRKTGLGPVAAGLATGAAMSLIADEMMTPALGFSAPNRAYPLSTHLRGFVAHLVFGLGVAAVTETGWRLLRQRPAPRTGRRT
jgi:hypothetical protein